MRFYVSSSRSGVDPYLVDIEANKGFGWCNCPQFSFRVQPALDRGAKATRCPHLTQARETFLDEIIERIRKEVRTTKR